MQLRVVSILVAITCMLVIFPLHAALMSDDEQAARVAVSEKATYWFNMHDYERLDATAADFRKTNARFKSGVWKLERFYDGLSLSSDASEAEWAELFRQFDEWKMQSPQSVTCRVALAAAWTDYAWKARGGGWANSVTDEGWRLFAERLEKAKTILDEAKTLPEKCPHWFAAMQTVALGESWSPEKYDALFQEATAFEPSYYYFYFNKAYYLLPKWHGSPGDWERFAEISASKTATSDKGMELYTRIAWACSGHYSNLFKESAVDWAKMKQGFLDIEKQFPDSTWNLVNFCCFAADSGDQETVVRLLKRIDDSSDVRKWRWPPEKLERAREFAKTNATDRPRETFSENENVRRLEFSPDGKSLAVGDDYGSVTIWDIAQHRSVWSAPPIGRGEPVSTLSFSPDGTLLAVGTGEATASSRGSVLVWDTVKRREAAKIDGWTGPVWNVKFTPDGKKLIMTGGPYNSRAEGRIWELATKKVTVMGWPLEHTHSLTAGAISPGSDFLATDCNRSITVWDLNGNRSLFETKQTLKNLVRVLAFSPDGKILAAGIGGGWGYSQNPGGVVFWDVPSFKEQSAEIVAPDNTVVSIAFSPDGKLLAWGGYDGSLHLWSMATQKEVARLFTNAMLTVVAFSRDGKTLATTNDAGGVYLWDTPKAQ
ncbi:MAG TPA: hypothetical protein VIT91_12465 [Chthoniobacterales bacterium]